MPLGARSILDIQDDNNLAVVARTIQHPKPNINNLADSILESQLDLKEIMRRKVDTNAVEMFVHF
jgi:hypothetical protein